MLKQQIPGFSGKTAFFHGRPLAAGYRKPEGRMPANIDIPSVHRRPRKKTP